MLCDSDIEEKGLLLLFISKWLSRDILLTVSEFLCLGSRKPCWEVPHNRVRHLEAHDDGEGVNRRADNGRMTVVDRDSLWDAQSMVSNLRSLNCVE